ncbi:MAG: hypothetical protein ABEH77_09685 [Halobacteriaceae archaeon]
MSATTDDRGVGLGLLFGLLALGAAGYTLVTSFQSATAASDAAAASLQVDAAVGFAASMVFGTLLVGALHLY